MTRPEDLPSLQFKMSGYAKLFGDIVDSSIWNEEPEICKVFVTMLALCDRDGYIRGSPGWLADKAKVRLDVCERSLKKFEAPDPTSRTPDNDGRRIERLPDGWLILNYIAFRDRLTDDQRHSSSRDRVRKHRETYKMLQGNNLNQNTMLHDVTRVTSASASVSVSEKKKKGGAGGNKLSDGEFLSALKGNPAFSHVDLNHELSKMDAWLMAHPGRQKTRRFVVAWLSRIEIPMKISPVKNNGQTPAINSVAQADSALSEVRATMNKLRGNDKSFSWDGGLKGGYTPETQKAMAALRGREDELKKLKMGVSP